MGASLQLQVVSPQDGNLLDHHKDRTVSAELLPLEWLTVKETIRRRAEQIAFAQDAATIKLTELGPGTGIVSNSCIGVMPVIPVIEQRGTCFSCGGTVPGVKAVVCGRCRSAHYCNEGCQRAHWHEHKKLCRPPAPHV